MICNLDGSNSVESAFLFVYIYLVALESSVLGEKFFQLKLQRITELGRVIFTWKHMKLSFSVNYPVRSRLWNPLTVWHSFPTKFMFTKAQLSITQENSPSRDVGHIIHLQDQQRATQFPVCVRTLKRLVKPKWFLIASCRIAVSFPFSPYAQLFFKVWLAIGFRSCWRFVIIYYFTAFMRLFHLKIQVPWTFPTCACCHKAEESVSFSPVFFWNPVSAILCWLVGFVKFVPVEKTSVSIGCGIACCFIRQLA